MNAKIIAGLKHLPGGYRASLRLAPASHCGVTVDFLFHLRMVASSRNGPIAVGLIETFELV